MKQVEISELEHLSDTPKNSGEPYSLDEDVNYELSHQMSNEETELVIRKNNKETSYSHDNQYIHCIYSSSIYQQSIQSFY